MSARLPELDNGANAGRTVLDLVVNNHPGVMSHICGLFSRRSFNLEGIICGPIGSGKFSRVLLLVDEDARLPQLLRELEKLHDVQIVEVRPDVSEHIFDPERLAGVSGAPRPAGEAGAERASP